MKPPRELGLAEQYEHLCQMIELANQTNDPFLIVATLYYGSQYYRRVGCFEGAVKILKKALGQCGPGHPLLAQIQADLDILSPQMMPDLNFWVFAKNGPLLLAQAPSIDIVVDEDLFGMFFAALQDFASEVAQAESGRQKRISNVQWDTGESFVVFHQPACGAFIVGFCPVGGDRGQIYRQIQQIYSRFTRAYRAELSNFQGDVQPFLEFTGQY